MAEKAREGGDNSGDFSPDTVPKVTLQKLQQRLRVTELQLESEKLHRVRLEEELLELQSPVIISATAADSDRFSSAEIAKASGPDADDAPKQLEKEYASLWSAVEELSKLDAEKDESLKELLKTREQAIAQRDAALLEIESLVAENRSLQQNIEEIDRDLAVYLQDSNSSRDSVLDCRVSS